MKGKIAFVLGAGLGYVLGSRAGRERYEQIKAGATKLWNTAPVQRGRDEVNGFVSTKTQRLQDSVVEAGKVFVKSVTDFSNSGRKDAARAVQEATSPAAPAQATPREAPEAGTTGAER
ncbi:YtxH domain-containing protein [Leucobacter sp. M11]|uniref:YtxH domain-containing protein n=1 Tax=Leucobacter sp. M11 TaxID=2993565 RepID=UPI002D7F9085|nr:YtxH domain-containing protein [Leucobacter sp. M11]MEB4615044.1 YtxH domain-containing protein [Leucobacter sp. M11]